MGVLLWVRVRQDIEEATALYRNDDLLESRELNPEERLNADLKHVIRSKVPVRTKAKLQAAALDHMTALQTKPERIKSFFQDPFVNYAT